MADDFTDYEGGEAPDVATAPEAAQPAQPSVWAPWDQVENHFRTAYPRANMDEIRKRWEQGRDLSIQRQRYAGAEQNALWLTERAAPFGSAIAATRQTMAHEEAVRRYENGNPEEGDAELIAAFERRQALRARDTSTVGGAITDALARTPAVLGEYLTGAKLLQGAAALFPRALGWLVPAASEASVFSRAGAAGALRNLPARAAAGTLQAPAMPSAWLNEGVERNYAAGRDASDPRGFRTPLALAAIQNTIFGTLGDVGGPAGEGFTAAAGRYATRVGVGVAEQQVADTVGSALGLQTGYGPLGAILRGANGEDMRQAAANIAAIAVLSALHEAPPRRAATPEAAHAPEAARLGEPPAEAPSGTSGTPSPEAPPGAPGAGRAQAPPEPHPVLKTFAELLTWFRQQPRSYPEATVGRILNGIRQDLDTFMAQNPDATRAEALHYFRGNDSMPGPLRRFLRELAQAFPETRPSEQPRAQPQEPAVPPGRGVGAGAGAPAAAGAAGWPPGAVSGPPNWGVWTISASAPEGPPASPAQRVLIGMRRRQAQQGPVPTPGGQVQPPRSQPLSPEGQAVVDSINEVSDRMGRDVARTILARAGEQARRRRQQEFLARPDEPSPQEEAQAAQSQDWRERVLGFRMERFGQFIDHALAEPNPETIGRVTGAIERMARMAQARGLSEGELHGRLPRLGEFVDMVLAHPEVVPHSEEVQNAINEAVRVAHDHGLVPASVRRGVEESLRSAEESARVVPETQASQGGQEEPAHPGAAAGGGEAGGKLVALQKLAGNAIPRSELKKTYRNMMKYGDLLEHGYSISHWLDPRNPQDQVLEYNPVTKGRMKAEFEGYPRLTARNGAEVDAIQEALGVPAPGRPERKPPVEGPQLTPHERMKRGQPIPKQYEAEARQIGVQPDALHGKAAEILGYDRQYTEQHNELLRTARDMLKKAGFTGNIRSEKYQDPTSIPGFDEVVQSLTGAGTGVRSQEGADLLRGDNPERQLFDLLKAGNRQTMSQEDAYREALNHLYDARQAEIRREDVARVNRELSQGGEKPLSASEIEEARQAAFDEFAGNVPGEHGQGEAHEPAGVQPGDFDPAEFGEPGRTHFTGLANPEAEFFAPRAEQGRLSFGSSETPQTLHEAQAEVRQRTAPTTLEQAWKEANPPPPEKGNSLFDAAQNVAKDFLQDEAGHFDPEQFRENLRAKIAEVGKLVNFVRDGVGRFSGKMFPTATRIDAKAGEAMARWSAAETYAHAAAEHYLAKILGENPSPADRLLAGAVITERRLRWMRQAYLQAGDREAAGKVTSIIGAEGSPLRTFADYRSALFSDKMQDVLKRWKDELVPVLDATYRKAQGLPVDDPIQSLTQIPGQPVNLKPEYGGADLPRTAAGNLKNLRARKLPFSNQATGDAPAYDIDLGNMIENSLQRGIPLAAKAEALRELHAAGMLKWNHERAGVEFDEGHGVEFPNVKPPAGTQAAGPGQTSAYVDPRIAEEFRNVMNLEQKEGYKKVAMALSQIPTIGALASSVEAATHSLNLAGGVFNAGVKLGDLMKNAYQRLFDKPKARERLLELARIGAQKPPGLETGTLTQSINRLAEWTTGHTLPENAKYYDPTYYAGRLLDGMSDIMRVTLSDAYDHLAARGDVKGSESGKRDFINEALGQYDKKAQNGLVRWIRETGIGPFATAGTTMTTRAARLLIGSTGAAASSVQASVRMRAEVLGKWAGVIAGAMLLNYLKWGRSDGDEHTPFGAIKLGQDAQGRTVYLDTPVSIQRRGLRAIGALAVIEGNRKGLARGQMLDRATSEILQSQLHPFLGPSYQFAHTAFTGKNAVGVQVAERVPQGQSQMTANVKAAFSTANPVIGAMTGSDRKDALSLKQKLIGLGGAWAPKVSHR